MLSVSISWAVSLFTVTCISQHNLWASEFYFLYFYSYSWDSFSFCFCLSFCGYFTVAVVSWPLQGTELLLSFASFWGVFWSLSLRLHVLSWKASLSWAFRTFEIYLRGWCLYLHPCVFPQHFVQCVLFHYVIFVIFTFLSSFSHSICLPVCLYLPTDSWCSGKFPTMWIHFCFLFTSVCLLNFFILQITMVSMNCTNWMLITQRHRNTLVLWMFDLFLICYKKNVK